jgi:hypothetical protein
MRAEEVEEDPDLLLILVRFPGGEQFGGCLFLEGSEGVLRSCGGLDLIRGVGTTVKERPKVSSSA